VIHPKIKLPSELPFWLCWTRLSAWTSQQDECSLAGSDCGHRILQDQEQKCLTLTRKAEHPEKGFSPVTLVKSFFVLY